MNDLAATGVAIFARGIIRHYEAGRIRALDGLNLEVAEGESVAICGPSGCGKSTLLNILAAIDKSDAGEVRIFGVDLKRLEASAADAFRSRTVGLVFQLHNLLPNLSVLENVQVPMMGDGATPRNGATLRNGAQPPSAVDREALPDGGGTVARPEGRGSTHAARASALLERVGLGDRLHARPTELSGGERQRVAVARALANRPRILLADEPTGALDSATGERLIDLLEELRRELGMTLVIVTHEAHVAARAGRIVHMKDGRIIG